MPAWPAGSRRPAAPVRCPRSRRPPSRCALPRRMRECRARSARRRSCARAGAPAAGGRVRSPRRSCVDRLRRWRLDGERLSRRLRHDHDVHAPVRGASGGRVVRRLRMELAVARGRQAARIDPLRDEQRDDGAGTRGRELPVGREACRRIAVSSVCPSTRTGFGSVCSVAASRPSSACAPSVTSALATAKVALSGRDSTTPRASSVTSSRPAAMASDIDSVRWTRTAAGASVSMPFHDRRPGCGTGASARTLAASAFDSASTRRVKNAISSVTRSVHRDEPPVGPAASVAAASDHDPTCAKAVVASAATACSTSRDCAATDHLEAAVRRAPSRAATARTGAGASLLLPRHHRLEDRPRGAGAASPVRAAVRRAAAAACWPRRAAHRRPRTPHAMPAPRADGSVRFRITWMRPSARTEDAEDRRVLRRGLEHTRGSSSCASRARISEPSTAQHAGVHAVHRPSVRP